jgi:hypothetical protein
LAAESLPAAATEEALSLEQLAPILQEAQARWRASGVRVPGPDRVEIGITDLPGDLLGLALGRKIWIDTNAAGWGWFVDLTPWGDSEFSTPGNQGEQGRMDLLTVVLHELGHVLGLDHEEQEESVMSERLSTGVRFGNLPDHDLALLSLLWETETPRERIKLQTY